MIFSDIFSWRFVACDVYKTFSVHATRPSLPLPTPYCQPPLHLSSQLVHWRPQETHDRVTCPWERSATARCVTADLDLSLQWSPGWRNKVGYHGEHRWQQGWHIRNIKCIYIYMYMYCSSDHCVTDHVIVKQRKTLVFVCKKFCQTCVFMHVQYHT